MKNAATYAYALPEGVTLESVTPEVYACHWPNALHWYDRTPHYRVAPGYALECACSHSPAHVNINSLTTGMGTSLNEALTDALATLESTDD